MGSPGGVGRARSAGRKKLGPTRPMGVDMEPDIEAAPGARAVRRGANLDRRVRLEH